MSTALLLLAGCTAMSGPARLEHGDRPVAFAGLLSKDPTGVKRRYVLQVHGINTTDNNAYANQLLGRIPDHGYVLKSSQDWTDVPLGATWTVRTPGRTSCTAKHPDCQYQTFGQYRRDVYVRGAETLTVYSYYWRADLWTILTPYLQPDIDSNSAPAFRFPSTRKSLFNATLKAGLMDNGFSDAAGYLSVLGRLERAGLESTICLMMADAGDFRIADQSLGNHCLQRLQPQMASLAAAPVEFDFLSHSLGSRMLFDVLSRYDPSEGERDETAQGARWVILNRSRNFFMAANQMPLLAVTDMAVRSDNESRASPRAAAEPGAEPPDHGGLAGMLSLRAETADRVGLGGAVAPQTEQLAVIAFQDPDDFLGFKASDALPGKPQGGPVIIDVVHRNAPQWGFLFEWPTIAHDHELREPHSLQMILCGATAGADGVLRAAACPG